MSTYRFDYQREYSLAARDRTMSPDRGAYQNYVDDLRYNQRYRDVRATQGVYDSLPRRPTRLCQPGNSGNRRNGFVYEDIYSKKAWCAEYKPKYDHSSPYKPIRSEFLTLPSHILANKYSTLPKSWSISSNNSYRNHFAPLQPAPTTSDLTFSPTYNYYRRPRPKGDQVQSLRYIKYFTDERNFDDAKAYNETHESLTFKRRQSVEDPFLWYNDLETSKIQRTRRPRPESIAYSQKDPFYPQDRGKKQQRIVSHHQLQQQYVAENECLTRSNNLVSRRNECETKKNVTFSEVSGCEVSKNGNGKQAVYVRELEVSFSQVADKCNIGKDYKPNRPIDKVKSLPNGHCLSGNGNGIDTRKIPVGKLPLKPGQPRGLFASITKRKYLSQVVAALAVSLAPFAAGLGKGYSSPAIASLQQLRPKRPYNSSVPNDISVSDQQASWVASLSLLGALFGGVMGGIAMRYGRRKVLLVMSLPFSLSWILTVFATSVEMMFFTSFMGGFCCSIVSMVSQVYVSEISLPDIRGCLNAVLKIVSHLGVLMSSAVGAYLDWQQLAMFISIAPIILFCTMIYIPETPSYLVLCGKDEEAYKSLAWLRGPGSDIMQELATIRAHVVATKSFRNRNIQVAGSNTINALFTARIAGPVMITCGLMLFQRFSGAHAFNFYAVPIFKKTFGGMNPHSGAIAVSFVQLLASCLSGLLIDTVGRLPLLITSSVFMSMALAGFGSYAYYEEVHKNQRSQNVLAQNLGVAGQNDWIPLLCVLVFTIAFSLGMSPISWLLIGELFPLEFRGTGSALATAFSYLCAFIGVKTFVDFHQTLGLHGAFWLYAVISVGGLCFVVCCVPETKGRDLDEMDPKSVQNLSINRPRIGA